MIAGLQNPGLRAFSLVLALGVCLSSARSDSLTFQPIYFQAGQDRLSDASKEALSRVAELLKSNSTVRIRLEGNTATAGDGTDPVALSQSRADAARGLLVKLGISDQRIETSARAAENLHEKLKGESPLNRRVDFVFLSPTGANETGKKLEEIEVIYWNTLYHCLYQIGADQGFFEKEGFKINLVATNHSYIDQVKAACAIEPFLKAGEKVFVGGVCGGSPHESIAKGVPLVVIGGLLSGGSMLMAKPEMAAKLRADWKNFKGITIGRPKGTVLTSMIVAYNVAKRGGLDPQKDIKWKLFDSHEGVVDALVAGTVDAGDTYAPLNLEAKRKHGLVEVYNTVELFPYHPCCRVITTQAKLKRNREKYVRFMKGVIRSHEFFVKQPTKAIEIVTKYTGYARPDVQASLTNANFQLNPDPLKNGFVKFWNMMNETGFIHSKKDINQYIDTSVYEDALKALIKEEPQNPYFAYMMKQFREQNL